MTNWNWLMQCNTLYYSTYYLTYKPHNLYHLSLPKHRYLYTQSWIHKFSEEVWGFSIHAWWAPPAFYLWVNAWSTGPLSSNSKHLQKRWKRQLYKLVPILWPMERRELAIEEPDLTKPAAYEWEASLSSLCPGEHEWNRISMRAPGERVSTCN